MNMDHAIILWSTRWTLVGGVVVCGQCLQGQGLSEDHRQFEHGSGCSNADEAGMHPWPDLHDILDAARG